LASQWVGLRIIDAARDQLRERLLPTTDNADKVTTELVGRGMVRAGPLMARAAVRTFGVVIVCVALHPKTPPPPRSRSSSWNGLSLAIDASSSRRHSPRVADDVAYGGRHERRGTIALTWRAEAAHHEVDARTA